MSKQADHKAEWVTAVTTTAGAEQQESRGYTDTMSQISSDYHKLTHTIQCANTHTLLETKDPLSDEAPTVQAVKVELQIHTNIKHRVSL